MATAVPDLLRFLSQDAKLSLALAMGKVLELQKAHLTKYAMTNVKSFTTNNFLVLSKFLKRTWKLCKESSKRTK